MNWQHNLVILRAHALPTELAGRLNLGILKSLMDSATLHYSSTMPIKKKKKRFLLILAEIVLSQGDNLNYPVLEPKISSISSIFISVFCFVLFFRSRLVATLKRRNRRRIRSCPRVKYQVGDDSPLQ